MTRPPAEVGRDSHSEGHSVCVGNVACRQCAPTRRTGAKSPNTLERPSARRHTRRCPPPSSPRCLSPPWWQRPPPTRGGQRPHLVLTMRLPDLLNGLGTAVLDTGGRLSAAQARRLACDACVIPLILGSDSMPLDVGRQQRLATTALRGALVQRDKGCAFPRPQATGIHPAPHRGPHQNTTPRSTSTVADQPRLLILGVARRRRSAAGWRALRASRSPAT